MTRGVLSLGVSLALVIAGGCDGDDEPPPSQGGGGASSSSGTGASAAGGSDPCGGIICDCPAYVGDEQAGSFCVGHELYDCAVTCYDCGCSCVGVFTAECDPGACIDHQDRQAHCSGAGGQGGGGGQGGN